MHSARQANVAKSEATKTGDASTLAPKSATLAALLLGGLWTLANPLRERTITVWVARLATGIWGILATIGSLVFGLFLLQRGTFYESAHHLTAPARVGAWKSGLDTFLIASLAHLILCIPLALKARRLLEESAWPRQSRQIRWACLLVGLVLFWSGIRLYEWSTASIERGEVDAEIAAAKRHGRPLPDYSGTGWVIIPDKETSTR